MSYTLVTIFVVFMALYLHVYHTYMQDLSPGYEHTVCYVVVKIYMHNYIIIIMQESTDASPQFNNDDKVAPHKKV